MKEKSKRSIHTSIHKIRTYEVKLKVGLIVEGVVGGFLVIVIILMTLKYRQTKVQFFYKIKYKGSHMSTA